MNASPGDSPDELVAMIPVEQKKAKQLEWEMPFGPLLKRLMEKTRGRVILADGGVPQISPAETPKLLWDEFLGRVKVSSSGICFTGPCHWRSDHDRDHIPAHGVR